MDEDTVVPPLCTERPLLPRKADDTGMLDNCSPRCSAPVLPDAIDPCCRLRASMRDLSAANLRRSQTAKQHHKQHTKAAINTSATTMKMITALAGGASYPLNSVLVRMQSSGDAHVAPTKQPLGLP
jgi:hypothetical protein